MSRGPTSKGGEGREGRKGEVDVGRGREEKGEGPTSKGREGIGGKGRGKGEEGRGRESGRGERSAVRRGLTPLSSPAPLVSSSDPVLDQLHVVIANGRKSQVCGRYLDCSRPITSRRGRLRSATQRRGRGHRGTV